MAFPVNFFQEMEKIRSQLSGKVPVLFLDYDGTLSPIVDVPDQAYMTSEMRDALRNVASQCFTAIVTGRAIDKIYNFVKLDNLVYAGSHGFDIRGPPSLPVQHQIGDSFRPCLQETMLILQDRLRHIQGAEIEDNHFAISVHYRHVNPLMHCEVEDIIDRIISNENCSLIKKHGKKVYELRPEIDWNKGRAVNWIMSQMGYDNDEFIPLYIGDDVSDEDAFSALRNRTLACGIGIIVRDPDAKSFDLPGGAKEVPATEALYSLRNPNEVQKFLCFISSLVSESKTRSSSADIPPDTGVPNLVKDVTSSIAVVPSSVHTTLE